MRIVLASASPRRKELLGRVFKQFEIIPAKGEELADLSLPPHEVACALAQSKCKEVFALNGDGMVIACDTIVVYEGEILGKPADAAEAKATLKRLSGKTHQVITGVCVRYEKSVKVGYESTLVTFNNLSEEFIDSYVAGGSPLDKAGSYGIQDEGVVGGFEGDYDNVVGMPVELVKKLCNELSAQ